MVYALHKFHHYLLGNKSIFHVDHMALLFLIQKPQVLGRISRWLLLLLEYDFTVICKLGKVRFVVDALSRMPDLTKECGVPNQTMNTPFFLLQPMWLEEVSKYFTTGKFPIQCN